MMKSMMLAAVLSIGASGYAGALGCAEKELAPGTALEDGTVVGESLALAFFKEKEPQLFERIGAMDAAKRKSYAAAFYWFQRPGNCRKAQKRQSIQDLKAALGLPYEQAAAEPAAVPQADAGGCGGPEASAGTVFADGTVAGERQALVYLQEKEPELYGRLAKLDKKELRKRFAEQLMWFQRVGPCRQRQKAESIRQLKAELGAATSATEYKNEADPRRKAEREKELRASLAERFDSDMALLEHEARSLEQNVKEMAREAEDVRRKIAERAKNRDAVIDKRLKELLAN